jgi:hypothetical protein
MKCDLCDEHVDPDDYQAHCEQHHNDGEYDERHPRPKFGSGINSGTIDWIVMESEDDGHFAKLVSPLGTIATMPRWQAIAIARMHNEALKTYSDELDKLSDSETEQWEAYGAVIMAKSERLAKAIRPFAKIAPELLTNRKTLSLFTEEDAIEAAAALENYEQS